MFGFILVAVALGFVGFALFFNKKAVIKRRLKRTPEKRMMDVLTDDVVKITGTIGLVGEILTAPLTGRLCAGYSVKVERHQSSGKSSRWVEVLNDERFGDVVIRQDRYYAVISTRRTKNYLNPDSQFRSGTFNDAPEVLEHYLKTKGMTSVNWIGLNKALRYSEGVLEKDEKITVVGKARWINKSELPYDLPSDRVLLIEPTQKEPVYFMDDQAKGQGRASWHVGGIPVR